MKRSKKLKRKLETRQRDYENLKTKQGFKKPGSNHK